MSVEWEDEDGISTRIYHSYDDYIDHQASKLANYDMPWLANYDKNYRSRLVGAIRHYYPDIAGKSVLCLAARLGTEVAAFIDVGCFSVGIDINPGFINQYVLYGDFHELQFAANSVDVVFSNSIDHVLYIDKFLSEIHRVLKPNGTFILDMVVKSGHDSGEWESLSWDKPTDLIKTIVRKGPFKFKRRCVFIPEWNRKLIFFDRKETEDERSMD